MLLNKYPRRRLFVKSFAILHPKIYCFWIVWYWKCTTSVTSNWLYMIHNEFHRPYWIKTCCTFAVFRNKSFLKKNKKTVMLFTLNIAVCIHIFDKIMINTDDFCWITLSRRNIWICCLCRRFFLVIRFY